MQEANEAKAGELLEEEKNKAAANARAALEVVEAAAETAVKAMVQAGYN
jgi:hypothetical protein